MCRGSEHPVRLAPCRCGTMDHDSQALALSIDPNVFMIASPTFAKPTAAKDEENAEEPERKVEYSLTAGEGWIIARDAKAEFALSSSDLESIDVRCVGGGFFDPRRPKNYYNRSDLAKLAVKKHGVNGIAKKVAKKTLVSPIRKTTRSQENRSANSPRKGTRKSPRVAAQAAKSKC